MGLLAYQVLLFLGFWAVTEAEDAYKYYTWNVTYSPKQQVILINGEFPGPVLDCVTNDNIIIDVINHLDEPFLLTWNGIKQRKNCWQDGVLGTNCPIPPNSNFTYKFQTKDQIGSYMYFPSTFMQRADGGYGPINVHQRSVISVPYAIPAGEFTLLISEHYTATHKGLQKILDSGRRHLPFPSALLMNGQNKLTLTAEQGKTYMFRVSNMGLSKTINVRIESHEMVVVEVEGCNVVPQAYNSLDIHVGQSFSILVTLNQPPKDYIIVASTRFTRKLLNVTSILHYNNSYIHPTGQIPPPPPGGYEWSMKQALSFRMNTTSNAARPNPQGSFHYGQINVSRTIILANSPTIIDGKKRYGVNGISFVYPDTPLKLADYFHIPDVFTLNSIPILPPPDYTTHPKMGTSVLGTPLHEFIEVVFQNNESSLQTWHLDGYSFWVVGLGRGQWTSDSRKYYNLVDAMSRHTVQVYPHSWTVIQVSLDNEGMWNLRSSIWERQYLGQQLYIKVYDSKKSLTEEYDIPSNVLLCGKAVGKKPT